MFIGGHRSPDWGGVEPGAEFLLNPSMIILPSCTSSVRALLRGRGWRRRAALPHLGPNTHCSIVLHLWTGGGGGAQYMEGTVDGPTECLRVGQVTGPSPRRWGWILNWGVVPEHLNQYGGLYICMCWQRVRQGGDCVTADKRRTNASPVRGTAWTHVVAMTIGVRPSV